MSILAERPPHVPRSRACAALGLSRTGTHPRARRRRSGPRATPVQPRALSEPERAQIRDLAHRARYRDASLAVLHATELNAGRVIASLSTFYRVLRTSGETGERRAQRVPYQHAVPHLVADRPHACWNWDISKLPTLIPRRYLNLNLYLILDLYSRYVIAGMISAKENGALAKHLFGQALARYDIADGQLSVHQDRGAPMIAETFRDLLARFGATRSYSRPRMSNDNAASESLFKTVKYRAPITRDASPTSIRRAPGWHSSLSTTSSAPTTASPSTPRPMSSMAASMRSTRAAKRHSTRTSPPIGSATRTARPRRSAHRRPWPSTPSTASRWPRPSPAQPHPKPLAARPCRCRTGSRLQHPAHRRALPTRWPALLRPSLGERERAPPRPSTSPPIDSVRATPHCRTGVKSNQQSHRRVSETR